MQTTAAILTGTGSEFSQATIDVEEPRADEVLVRIEAVGLCHTDLVVRDGGIPLAFPGVVGHEGAGIVIQAGADVTGLVPGDNSSVGLPLMHVDARIGGPDDEDVAPGTVGELLLRGPNIARGYWGLPDASAEAWRNGWFHTGDLAKVDEEGYFYIVDRKKDMVITGGENVYSAEVEQVLYRHDGIEEVAVIGVPDEKWGETVVAVATAKPGAELSPDDVIAFCRDRLAHYKCPTRVIVKDELPHTASGKLLKRGLREHYAGSSSAVSR